MLTKIQETENSLSLIHNDCTIDDSIVQSIILEFTKKSRYKLTINSVVKPNDFVNCDKKLYWTIQKTQELKKSNVYDVKYYILRYQTKIATNIIEGNLVNGVEILHDFHDTDYISINDIIYKIDKQHSSVNQLFLTEPVKNIPETLIYNPVLYYKQCLFLNYEINKLLKKQIAQIPVCDNCNEEITTLMCDLFSLIRVENAIECNDCISAKNIFNNLKNKYSNDLC